MARNKRLHWGGVLWQIVAVQIRLNKLNEKRVKLRVKSHGGTPTLMANMILNIVFDAEEKQVRKVASDLSGAISKQLETKP